jgi:hypothetical protein
VQNGWGVAERIENGVTGSDNYYYPQVTIDNAGNAIAVWQKLDGTALSIWTNRYAAGLGWGAAQPLETEQTYGAYLPQVAMNRHGDATVVWEQFDGTRYNIWARQYVSGTGWLTPSLVDSNDAGDAYSVQVAMDDNGNAVAVWEQFDGTRFNVWGNVYSPDTGWSTAERVEYNTTGASEYYVPQVAMDNNGNATVVWRQFDGDTVSIWANRYSNGAWETAQRIERLDITNSMSPQVAMDAYGNAMVVWEQFDDSSTYPVVSIWGNRYTSGSGWGEAQALETNVTDHMWYPQVAMDDYGNAIAVWWHSGATEDDIYAAHNALHTTLPVADAGTDQSAYIRDIVTLDGSASYTTDNQLLSYHWQQLSGIEVLLENATTSAPSFKAPNTKVTIELEFILTVTDVNGVLATDNVVVTVLP